MSADGELVGEVGTVVEVHGVLATVALHGEGRRVRCVPPGPEHKPVVGDRVTVVEGGPGPPRIVAIAPRERLVERRPQPHKVQPVASWVDRLIIVSAVEPPPRPGLIDRILVTLGPSDVEVVLVANKVDLPGAAAGLALLAAYTEAPIGARLLATSAVTGEGLAALLELVTVGVSVVVGHSGVGKSSLLNAIIPEAEIRTGRVNDKTSKGRHTTTVSTAHEVGAPWPAGGLMVDTPGFRAWPLHGILLEEVARRYPGFGGLAARCHYGDCLHEGEPGCAVRAAAEAGSLAPGRLEAYQGLLAQLREERAEPAPKRRR